MADELEEQKQEAVQTSDEQTQEHASETLTVEEEVAREELPHTEEPANPEERVPTAETLAEVEPELAAAVVGEEPESKQEEAVAAEEQTVPAPSEAELQPETATVETVQAATEQPSAPEAPAAPEKTAVAPVESSAPEAAAPAAEAAPEKPAKAPKKAKEKKRGSTFVVFGDDRDNLPWYVVHAYSGYEMRAKLNLEERVRAAGLTAKFGNVIVPEERVVELVRGEKKTSTRKFYPGYMLVQCELNDDTWHLVKETPKITGFVGDSRNPAPITAAEVKNLLQQMEGGAQRPRPSVQFEQGDAVKVVDGPFAEFNGTVDEVKADKGKLRVLISIFGRNTPVELDFVQVEKV